MLENIEREPFANNMAVVESSGREICAYPRFEGWLYSTFEIAKRVSVLSSQILIFLKINKQTDDKFNMN